MKQLLLLLCLPLCLGAQEAEWALFINGSEDEFINGLATDAEGNVYGVGTFEGTITIGESQYFALGNTDGFLFKASPEGEFLWQRGLGDFMEDAVQDIQLADNGGLLVTGYFDGQLFYDEQLVLTAQGGGTNIFMLWLNQDGALQRAAQVGSSDFAFSRNFFQAQDGAFYLAGTFEGSLEYRNLVLENEDAEPDPFILKLSPELNVVWHKHLLANDAANTMEIQEGPDEGIYYTLYFEGQLTLNGLSLSASQADAAVFKFNKFGQRLWHQSLTGPGTTRFRSLSVGPYGNVYLTGLFVGEVALGNLQAMSSDNASDLFVCKISNEGEPLWLYTYESSAYNEGICVRASPAGGFWLSGLYGNSINLGGIPLTETGASGDGFLAKFDDAGNAQWAETINGPERDWMWRFTPHPDGPVYGSGVFWGATQIGGIAGNAQDGRDIAVFRIECPVDKPVITQSGNSLFTTENYASYQWYKDGRAISSNGATATAQGAGLYQVAVETPSGCVTLSEATDIMVAVEEAGRMAPARIYPNPGREKIFIDNWPWAAGSRVRLLSLQGTVLHRWGGSQADAAGPLELPPLPAGVYFIELTNPQGRQVFRLLVQ